jgi:hypothetical protein
MKAYVAAGCVAVAAGVSGAEIVGMHDSTGLPLIERLLAGSGATTADLRADRTQYVGLTDAGAQAGLYSSLVLRGAEGTSQTLGSGIMLTSGLATGLPSQNEIGWYSNVTGTGGNNYFRDFPAQTGTSRHGGRLQEHDENAITFELWVPEGVNGLTADFVYASEEFPEWSGTQYADGFAFFVNNVNYARLADGRPVSLLSETDNIHFMTNGDSMDPSVPSVADVEYDGLSRVLELTARLEPGRYNEITIVVADTGDEIYDSAVFLSSLRFLEGESPLPDDDCSVRLRRRGSEDDTYQEFEGVPAPGAMALGVVGGVLMGRRRRR